MPKLRAPNTQRIPAVTERVPKTAHLFQRGHAKLGGRPRGQGNLISADTRREILRGIAAHGADGKGEGGIAGAVYRAVADSSRNAVSLLCAITPKEISAQINKVETIRYKSINDVAADLEKMGIRMPELFGPDFVGDEVEVEVLENVSNVAPK
jgi:hypothetical protein